MATGIFIEEGDRLIELKEEAYELELVLQELLSKYPALISGSFDNADSENKLILVKAEAKLKAESDTSSNWWVDHLFLDSTGVPTIVEVKRSTDTRIRREVIGQILEYAANAVTQFSAESLRLLMDDNFENKTDGAMSKIEDLFGPDIDVDEYWQTVQTNLQAGRIRLLLVADKIPRETKRVIEFLNEQMSPTEILAIEVKQYSAQGKNMYIPTIFGQSIQSQTKKTGSGPKRQWDAASFIQEIESTNPKSVSIARKLLNECRARGVRDWWGIGAQSGSYFPMIDGKDNWYAMFALWTYGSAVVEIEFQHIKNKPPFDDEIIRRELQEMLNRIPGVNIQSDKLTKRPSFPMAVLNDEENMKIFLDTFDWFIKQISSVQ